MDTQNNNLPFKANEVISILQTAPDILARNEASVSACTNAGKTLLDTIEGNGGIGTDEIDTAVQEYLAKSKKTVENMNNRRKPLTQMLTAISKRFTTLEGSIDAKSKGTIPYLLQMERNKYAAKKLEEQKRRGKRARQKQLAENEKAQYRADITVLLRYHVRHLRREAYQRLERDFQSCLPSHVWGRMPADHANKHRFLMDGFREKRRG